ncbi:hypothetical protein BDW59DRAFT_165872 [Aspergillus cavernicola]|uniref:BTB domain-containing protein n=1 Tax=Aspergillus cavernicola TaxID=176166 RepID=A0ABR4HQF3_9EURO
MDAPVNKNDLPAAQRPDISQTTYPVAQYKVPITQPLINNPPTVNNSQPQLSTYGMEVILLLIGPTEKPYEVPRRTFITKPQTHLQQAPNGLVYATLPDVDEDVAHTVGNYFLAGAYQTLAKGPDEQISHRTLEYRRTVLTYRAAVRYGINGLVAHARRYMCLFSPHIPTMDIIDIGRKTFPRISQDTWYASYLAQEIRRRYRAGENIFGRDEYLKAFGVTAEFDAFLDHVQARICNANLAAEPRKEVPEPTPDGPQVYKRDSAEDVMLDNNSPVTVVSVSGEYTTDDGPQVHNEDSGEAEENMNSNEEAENRGTNMTNEELLESPGILAEHAIRNSRFIGTAGTE